MEGVTIDFEQELAATPLAELFAQVPLLPGLPGASVGPNDLIQIVQARQVASLSIGRAEAATTSSPPFELPELEVDIDAPAPAGAPVALGPSPGSSATAGGAPGGPPAAPGGTGRAVGPISTGGGFPLAGVLGPGTVLAALAGAVILSLCTRKLPDWAMDGAATGEVCDDVRADTGRRSCSRAASPRS